MKVRAVFLTLVLCLVGAAGCYAEAPIAGTWKLNEAKSKIAPGTGKNTSVVYSTEGDKIKVSTDGVNGSGEPVHGEWVGKFDGKDYPVTGDAGVDMRAVKQVNEHTLTIANKKNGQTVATGKVVVAPDGKSRILTTSRTDAQGKKITNTYYYDKE